MAESTASNMRRVDWLYAVLLTLIAAFVGGSWKSSESESVSFRREFKEELAKSREEGTRAAKELGEKVTSVQVTVASMGAKFDALVARDLVSRAEYDAMKDELLRRLTVLEKKG